MGRTRTYERFLRARIASRRIWQVTLWVIGLAVMQALLPGPEMATARAWLDMVLSRLR